MAVTRAAAVAGAFYPADPRELTAAVRRYLSQAEPLPAATRPPKALIVPHAGYIYSGSIAASAFVCLEPARDRIRRVILLGPAHRVPVRGLAASGADAFATPLGQVAVDTGAVAGVARLPQVIVDDEAHRLEHCLEVELPFLQYLLTDFAIVPFVVGDARTGDVAEVINLLWDGPETLVVVSSDLSHYHDHATATRMDRAAARAIEALQPEALASEQACGRNAVRGLLAAAKARGLSACTLDLRNSGDTAGPHGEVVGYGAFALA
jgi:hypothetical protein